MNAKEKAFELFNKMKKHTECKCNSWDDDNANDSALVAVEEILKADLRSSPYQTESPFKYWSNVKQEIEKL
jgi:hypothetical protein